MTEFTPYPGAATAEPASPEDLYVVAVTSDLAQGMLTPDPVTTPMSYEQAMTLLDRIARGEPCEILDDEVDLMAEITPGHLLGYRASNVFRSATTYDIRIARVLFSR